MFHKLYRIISVLKLPIIFITGNLPVSKLPLCTQLTRNLSGTHNTIRMTRFVSAHRTESRVTDVSHTVRGSEFHSGVHRLLKDGETGGRGKPGPSCI